MKNKEFNSEKLVGFSIIDFNNFSIISDSYGNLKKIKTWNDVSLFLTCSKYRNCFNLFYDTQDFEVILKHLPEPKHSELLDDGLTQIKHNEIIHYPFIPKNTLKIRNKHRSYNFVDIKSHYETRKKDLVQKHLDIKMDLILHGDIEINECLVNARYVKKLGEINNTEIVELFNKIKYVRVRKRASWRYIQESSIKQREKMLKWRWYAAPKKDNPSKEIIDLVESINYARINNLPTIIELGKPHKNIIWKKIIIHDKKWIQIRDSFIRSNEWLGFRKKFIDKNKRCSKCGKIKKELHLHHKSPYNLDSTVIEEGFLKAFEYPERFTVVCKDCHYLEHKDLIEFEAAL